MRILIVISIAGQF